MGILPFFLPFLLFCLLFFLLFCDGGHGPPCISHGLVSYPTF
jgi:hypothetical protein